MEVVQGRQRKIYAMTERGRAAFQVAVEAWMEVTQCLVQNECVTGAQPSLRRDASKFFVRLYRPSMH
jgi:DNA-binding PadR family transcriptional regulator